MSSKFIFVVDTETYSGNFEREMAAFITGLTEEHFSVVAETLAEEALSDPEFPFQNDDAFRDITAYAGDHNDHCPDSYVSIWPTEGWSNDGMGIHTRGPGQYPAYLSVALFFLDRPSDEVIAFMKKRAVMFPVRHKEEQIGITGFRLIEEATECKELDSWKHS